MRQEITTALLAAATLIGCGHSSTTPRPSGLTVVEIEPESDWQTQVDAVRAVRSTEIRVSERVVRSDDFRDLADRCDGLKALVLDQADLSTDDLSLLPSLPNLSWLKLPTPVDDDAAAILAECRNLETLNLPVADLSDAGLAKFASLPRLTLLRIASPQVTDTGLKRLSEAPVLRFLHLLDVPITDAGLEHVAAIRTLESFYLDGGRATDAGLARFLEARPDVHLHVGEGHLPGDPNADDHGPQSRP